jgi:hypothetical protein
MSKVLVVLSLVLLLGACSSLIPDQSVTNPFGLDGKSVTLSQQAQLQESQLKQPGLNAQALSATLSGAITASFNDFDQDLPGGIRPSGISENLGIGANVQVRSASGVGEAAFPNTLSVVASQLTFTVKDGSGQPTVTKTFTSASGLNLVINKGTCQVGSGVTCTYTTNAVGTVLLLLQLVGSDFSTFFDILSEGSEPNTLEGTFSLTVSGDALFPSDSQVTVVLETTQGTLSF